MLVFWIKREINIDKQKIVNLLSCDIGLYMENNDIIINGTEATWTMKPIEGVLGGTYLGTFVFKCYLSPLQQLQAGREYREYLGPLATSASETEFQIAYALTQLKQRIVKSPPFWSATLQDSNVSGNIGELHIIMLVLDASARAESMFIEQIKKERDNLLNKTIASGEEILKKD
jgi:hypothetical protein